MKRYLANFIIATGIAMFFVACNNPFATRTPQKPDNVTGVAIKPPTSAENVLWNLRASFESMSVQDYLDLFTEDFVFNPDYDDSITYIEEFRNGWTMDQETAFAENFLQISINSEIEVYPNYEYKPGEGMYDYIYSMKIFQPDSTAHPSATKTAAALTKRFDVKGHAYIYLRDDTEGKWRIYKWTEIENMTADYLTWGVLRAEYAGW